MDENKIYITGGTADLTNSEMTGIMQTVSKVIRHELYKGVGAAGTNITADIALIKFSTPLTFTEGVKPAKLPNKWPSPKTSFATVSGWGNIKVRTNIFGA